MDLGLGGRGYLLTGASRGMGFATARALVDDGARVRIDTPGEANYYRNGGIMQYVLRSLRDSAA